MVILFPTHASITDASTVELAKALGLSNRLRKWHSRARNSAAASYSTSGLMIVDAADYLVIDGLEWLRVIQDVTGVYIVLINNLRRLSSPPVQPKSQIIWSSCTAVLPSLDAGKRLKSGFGRDCCCLGHGLRELADANTSDCLESRHLTALSYILFQAWIADG
ncbi:MAG: hypothetical protein ACTXOO_03570 [Sodalis sp. (in: enterobacteria)]